MLRSSLLKFIMGDFSVGLVEIGFTWMEKWIGFIKAEVYLDQILCWASHLPKEVGVKEVHCKMAC